MLADPQSVTVAGSTVAIPRVGVGPDTATYRSADGTIQLTIAHQYNAKRVRRTISVAQTSVVTDPLIPSNSVPTYQRFYLVWDLPKAGLSVTDEKALTDGLLAFLNASSGAAITKILGGES